MENDFNKLGGVGASECGKLFTGQGLKAKTAQTFAFEKACELLGFERKDITTKPMLHGLYSELEAFENVVLPFYPNALLKSNESIDVEEIARAKTNVLINLMNL